MRIIPAIDIIGGKCVRLTKGDYDTKKVYSEKPLEVALQFEAHGLEYLHLVDLDGARSGQIVNQAVLEEIAGKTNLKVDFGGGLKSTEDLRIAFESGANQVTGGSIAVKKPEIFESWIEEFGPEKIILGADARDEKVAIAGWEEDSEIDLIGFIKDYMDKGVRYVVCTDISKDGMLQGPSFELYSRIMQKTASLETKVSLSGVEDRYVNPLKLIASGGISSLEELPRLKAIGCEGAILGKAIYENRISLEELSRLKQEL